MTSIEDPRISKLPNTSYHESDCIAHAVTRGWVPSVSGTVRMLEIRFFVRNHTKTNIPNTPPAVGGRGRSGGGRGGEKEGRKEGRRKGGSASPARYHRLGITGSLSPARHHRLAAPGRRLRLGNTGSVSTARYHHRLGINGSGAERGRARGAKGVGRATNQPDYHILSRTDRIQRARTAQPLNAQGNTGGGGELEPIPLLLHVLWNPIHDRMELAAS